MKNFDQLKHKQINASLSARISYAHLFNLSAYPDKPEQITTATETLTPGHVACLGWNQLLAISPVVS